MPELQEWIYKLEQGEGVRHVKVALAFFAFVALALVFNSRGYHNYSTEEAMDVGQLARNISQGKGFTTDNIRPLSLFLVSSHRQDHDAGLKKDHPDLANAPAYPLMLGGLMKILPFNFEIRSGAQATFLVFQPERWITFFNEALFLCAILLLFFLTKGLFDHAIAWMGAIVFAGSALLWRSSASGLSTLLLICMVLILVRLLLKLHQNEFAEVPGPAGRTLGWAAAIGAWLGLMGLTRYAVGWLIVPTVVLVVVSFPRGRFRNALALVVGFGVVMSPWLTRNYQESGTLFGTAGYAMQRLTDSFPDDTLDRSLDPTRGLNLLSYTDYIRKFSVNARDLVQNGLPRLGGSWLTAFFLVGLVVPFRDARLIFLRRWLLVSLVVMFFVEGLAKTHLGGDQPELSSENLLLLFCPLVFMFGVAFYALLIEQAALPFPQLRYVVDAFFCVLMSGPLVLALLPPKTYPSAYPPYYPPSIQTTAQLMKTNELMMSDVPWAISWYGGRRAVLLTLDSEQDFYKINDEWKSIHAIFLTPKTMDTHFLGMVRDHRNWGRFALEILANKEVPHGFPLKSAWYGLLPEQLFLTDWERWKAAKSSDR